MKTICIVLSICIMFWTIPALAQSIQSDYDSSYDLTKLKSYDFALQNQRIQATLMQNSLNDKRIKEALESQLGANGFEKPETGKPDFYISYRIGSRPTTRTVTRNMPATRRGGGGTIEVPQRFTEGSLIVDFIESAGNQLVWRGYATDPIDPAKPEKIIKKGIEKMVKQFMKDSGRKK
jgi:hypothetical protein